MYRQSPGRNHRSKGVRVKTILQICLLLAVCFWLIYQVKHSHDKKKEFDESDAKASLQTVSSDELIRFGRKDIRPLVEGTTSKSENRDEQSDEEEVNGEEAEEIKHEENEPEEKKVEGKEDDGTGGGDDDTDEHEQEISDGEFDREHELVDSDERGDGDERVTQETDSEDGHVKIEKEGTAEETDHDGDDRSTHEAREEHYKADDASSAVTHDTQTVTTENVNEHIGNSTEHTENILGEENKESDSEDSYKSEERKELEVEGGEVAKDGHPSNATTRETKVNMLDNSENGSSTNITLTEGSYAHLKINNTSEVTIENHDLTPENATEIKPELSHFQGNLTDENVLISDASTEAGNTELALQKDVEVEGETEKLDTSDGTYDRLETTLSENPEEVQQDAIDISDTSDSMEEKDVRTDLDTLPEIQTEGNSNEDFAAE